MNRSITSRILIVVLAFALCGIPEVLAQSVQSLPDAPHASRLLAQNTAPQSPQDQSAAPASQQPATPPGDQPRVVPVEPPKATGTEDEQPQAAPTGDQQAPAPKTVAPADPAELNQLESTQRQNEPAAAPPNDRINPLGTAAAEKGETAGGGASRPAGVAIAPAKQKRSRSLLIKLGAIAAAGAAIGTVYALTRGTSSVPPGAER